MSGRRISQILGSSNVHARILRAALTRVPTYPLDLIDGGLDS